MNKKAYTNFIDQYNNALIGNILHMPVTHGIDLLDDTTGIEIKSKDRYWFHTFACRLDQIENYPIENIGKELFWGFVLYDISKRVEEVQESDKLSELVSNIEVYFLEWDAHHSFRNSTPKSEVAYKYAHKKEFSQRTFQTYVVQDVTFHIPREAKSLERKLR